MPSPQIRPGPVNLGVVSAVRGSVVDVRFDAALPKIRTLLRSGGHNEIVIEVSFPRNFVFQR